MEIELGMPRGAGAVVAVRARAASSSSSSSGWVALYEGPPASDGAGGRRTARRWSPPVCRVHFAVAEVRIEFDTSVATGAPHGLSLDYLKVIGTRDLAAAALPTHDPTLLYVPHPEAAGADSFSFAASDCPGDHLRLSQPAEVSLNILERNDGPEAGGGRVSLLIGERKAVRLNASDVDDDNSQLAVHVVEYTSKFLQHISSLHVLRPSSGFLSGENITDFEAGEALATGASAESGPTTEPPTRVRRLKQADGISRDEPSFESNQRGSAEVAAAAAALLDEDYNDGDDSDAAAAPVDSEAYGGFWVVLSAPDYLDGELERTIYEENGAATRECAMGEFVYEVTDAEGLARNGTVKVELCSVDSFSVMDSETLLIIAVGSFSILMIAAFILVFHFAWKRFRQAAAARREQEERKVARVRTAIRSVR